MKGKWLTLAALAILTHAPLLSAATPADCAKAAHALGWEMKIDQIIRLCRGAYSVEPVQCAKEAHQLGWEMKIEQIIDLCALGGTPR